MMLTDPKGKGNVILAGYKVTQGKKTNVQEGKESSLERHISYHYSYLTRYLRPRFQHPTPCLLPKQEA